MPVVQLLREGSKFNRHKKEEILPENSSSGVGVVGINTIWLGAECLELEVTGL